KNRSIKKFLTFSGICLREVKMTVSTLYINGQWTIEQEQEYFQSINQATKEVVGRSCLASKAQVDQAVEAANEAFKDWRLTSYPSRSVYLEKMIEGLKNRREEFARMMTMEMGKALPESLGEVDTIIQHAEYMKGEGRRLIGEMVPSAFSNRTIQMV